MGADSHPEASASAPKATSWKSESESICRVVTVMAGVRLMSVVYLCCDQDDVLVRGGQRAESAPEIEVPEWIAYSYAESVNAR